MIANLLIEPTVIGRTPRHLGVNIEIQEDHNRTNLWDWLADSGSTVRQNAHRCGSGADRDSAFGLTQARQGARRSLPLAAARHATLGS